MSSLKRRLIWTLLSLTLLLWLLMAAISFVSISQALQQQVDRQLEHYSHLVTYISRIFARQIDEGLPLYESWSENPLEQLRKRPMVVAGPGTDGLTPAVNIWLNDRLIAVMAGSPQFAQPRAGGFTYIDHGDNGLRWRVLTRYDEVSELWIRVGVEISAARRAILGTLGRKLWPLIILLPLTVAVMYLGVSRGLMPLNALARQISRRKPGLLDPVESSDVPQEVQGLVAALNRLLQRLAKALEAEQRFTANAAHELLTPLAAIKTEVQVCQRQLDDERGAAMLSRIGQRVDRASHTVEQLLTLARVDPEAPLAVQPIALRRLLVELLAETAHLAADRQLRVELAEGDEVTLSGNPEGLATLLRNLLVNAFRYASDDSVVAISLAADDRTELTICNDCRPLSAEEFAKLDDRFYRVPGSTGLGAGLGLSIVKRIADQHGASFSMAPRDERGGFCARVTFSKPGPGS